MAGRSVTILSARLPGAPPDLPLAGRLYVPADETDPEWRASDRGCLPGLVVGHGAGSRALRHEAFCLEACRQGFVVLGLDFRGHGDSDGVADGPLELDIMAAADFLRDHPAVDAGCICYRGSSMGGFYGLKAATPAGLTAIALLCPAPPSAMLALLESDLEQLSSDTESTAAISAASAPHAGTRWDVAAMHAYFREQNSSALAALVRCPVLLVHARGDEQVPIGHSVALAAGLPSHTTLVALEGGSHTSAQHDPEITRLTVTWLLQAGGKMERSTGFEPATFGLGSRRSAN